MNNKKLLFTLVSGMIFSISLTTATSINFPKPALAQDFCTNQGMRIYAYGETRRYNVSICKSGSGLELYYVGGDVNDYTRLASAYYDNKLRGYKFGNDYYRGRVTRKEFVVYKLSQNDESENRLMINEKFRKFKQY
ncbi:hypothetical protein [Calothrix sp. PCC 7507]|uniref:hypothetical protein n=1 Tax=Calothrix sp. PCC 7507 TaxID=99598 RepID=UPI00029EF718|nr:hypothetical protein [Calothrix sp. PCC 7507]AFY31173.1 hypothetical protein Cal7507_0684 [Calothrix sp. PCC 7507]